jgi:sugar lactone lactonase YvrE
LWQKIFAGIFLIIGIILIYLLFWPVPISPAQWNPPEAPTLTGVYEPNTRLASAERLETGGFGPEDVAFDDQGKIYTGLEDGRIMRLQNGSQPQVFAYTGGSPLGLCFNPSGDLIVADADKGLLSISKEGSIRVLSTEAEGVPFKLTDGVDIAKDGTIYFSDASFKFSNKDYMYDLMENQPNGRLLAYYPSNNSTKVLLHDLHFANGVAVSSDQSFVLVAETNRYQILRYWLRGRNKSKSDIFISNLPGFPDGVSSNGNDTFWVALVAPRDRSLDDQLLPNPFLRKILMRLPSQFTASTPYGFVLGLNENGNVTYNLQDPLGAFKQITNAREYRGMLYLGTIGEESLGCLRIS